ncbi:MAG: NADH:ubiquinone oxidoreductase [Candidatus Cloacimonetes bacterium]|nr:NADH:ubiquinone oxidoreductase [Candidatus Cloacimonadota bacterium]
MFNLIKARIRHGYQAIPNPLKTQIHPSFPGRPSLSGKADLEALNRLCPVSAFEKKGLDLGKCVFCGLCERKYPDWICFNPDFKIAADKRENLIITPEQATMPLIQAIKGFKHSFAMRNVSAGGCNACELELGASNNVNFDIGRYGIEIVASPRHADAVIVTGPISKNMADALHATWQATPQPRYLILCGSCAISGGVFSNSVQLDRSFLSHWQACLYIPGCPVHPLSIVHGIHSLMGAK